MYQKAVPRKSLKFRGISKLPLCSNFYLCDVKHLFWFVSTIIYLDLVSHLLAQRVAANVTWVVVVRKWVGEYMNGSRAYSNGLLVKQITLFRNKTPQVSAHAIFTIGLLFTELHCSNITLSHITNFSTSTGSHASHIDMVLRSSIIFILSLGF